MKLFIAIVLVAGLGTVVATIVVGSLVKEDVVVDRPYETGLGYDADRAARAALGWTARVEEAGLGPGPSTVRFSLWDGAGAPLEGAEVKVAATRPETSRDRVTAQATPLGGGAYEAQLAFAGPGPWVIQLDVTRGAERLPLEREVTVSERPPSPRPSPPAKRGERGTDLACDLARTPCTRALGDGRALTLDLGPRPLKAFADLAVTAGVRDAEGRAVSGAEVSVSFEMPGMFMGENRAALAAAPGGGYAGKAVLVRCPSGRRDWRATVTVRGAGRADESAAFDFRVDE